MMRQSGWSGALPLLALLAALLACKSQKSESTAETPPAATPAVIPAEEPTSTAAPEEIPRPSADESAPGKPVKLTSEEVASRLKQTMHGHVAIPEQSFALTVTGLGEISVLSTTSPNGSELVWHVYNAEGTRTQSLLNKNVATLNATKLLAVSFPDVDGDSNQDFVALASYTPPAGAQRAINAAAVFTRPGGRGFVFDAARSERASQGNPTSIAAAIRAAR